MFTSHAACNDGYIDRADILEHFFSTYVHFGTVPGTCRTKQEKQRTTSNKKNNIGSNTDSRKKTHTFEYKTGNLSSAGFDSATGECNGVLSVEG